MAREAFKDNAGLINGGLLYTLPVGHEEEDPQDKSFAVDRTALTSGVGYVRQQGTPTPTIFKLKGWILTTAQLEMMEAFYKACAGIGTPSRTVFWTDIEKGVHEVLITDFKPQRVFGRSRDGHAFVWKYELVLEVIA